jgi:chromosome segregation ATPase
MEKKIKIVCLLICFGFICGNSVFADKGNTSYLNGKPFRELYTLIENNQNSIYDLTVTTDVLRQELDTVKIDVENLEEAVAINTMNISLTQTELTEMSGSLDEAFTQLSELNAELMDLNQDVENNSEAIQSNTENISLLEQMLKTEISIAYEKMSALKSELETYKTNLDELRLVVEQTRQSIDSQIDDIRLRIQQIKGDVDANAELTANELAMATYAIATLTADMQSLSTDLNNLQDKYDNHKHAYNDAYEQYVTTTQVLVGYTYVWDSGHFWMEWPPTWFMTGPPPKPNSSCVHQSIGFDHWWMCRKQKVVPVYEEQEVINYETTPGETGTPNQ